MVRFYYPYECHADYFDCERIEARKLAIEACGISFFFQAEDGIRDKLVTVVQTCALPIYSTLGGPNKRTTPTKVSPRAEPSGGVREKLVVAMPKTYGKTETMSLWGNYFSHLSRCGNVRSEERRVGKECRTRWSPNPEEKSG